MATKQEVKHVIEQMATTVETAASTLGVNEGAGNAAKFEIAKFMMYLSASDGEIQWSEASMISDLCGLNLTPQTLGTFIREQNIYSTEFESKVPVTLQIMVTMDNKLIELNLADDVPETAGLILNTYKLAAEMLMNADGNIDSNEQADYQIYLNMLENYVNNNAVRRKRSVSGFMKNSGAVNVPTKSGVSAPKKKG